MEALAPVKFQSDPDAYRVMVVDDSAVIRGLISRWLDADPAIQVVATAHNGVMALRNLASSRPEVIVLDVEMPEMDGMTALPQLIAADPYIQVIMASTLTRRNAETSMKALAAGAAEYVPKPSSAREVNTSADFRREILEKVKALGAVARAAKQRQQPKVLRARQPQAEPRPAPRQRILQLRKPSSAVPRILALGSSTGGPQALFEFFKSFRPPSDLPVLITQHMPPTFTAILADHIQRASGRPCREAIDGECLLGGHIYVAPGNRHMFLSGDANRAVVRVTDDPPENFCRPSVDPMLRSVARIYGAASLVVILTGMGSDGLDGCRAIVQAGGTVLTQDEQSSVVWGMPGAVSNAGLASAILPLPQLAPAVSKLIRGDRS